MFYASDVSSAADTAAFAMEEHGLTPDQVQELTERIEATINDYFASLRGQSDDSNAR
jgi:broad specificity phosphatase PhoE